MGNLERLNVLVDADLADLNLIDDLHGWRFRLLLKQDQVQQRLRRYPGRWRQFELLNRKLEQLRRKEAR
jgi:hypothetical protein